MPGKTSSRFSALKALYDTNPKVFEEFLQAFSEDLGIGSSTQTAAVSVSCPKCNLPIQLSVGISRASGARRGRPPKRLAKPQKEMKKVRISNFRAGTLNALVLKLAKLRREMVGDIHSKFTRHLGPKARKMSKEEYRAKKQAWLKSEISRITGTKKRRVA